MHMLKVNVDGAFQDSPKSAAIGIICRDHWGEMKWAFVDKVKSISIFMTEALALQRALMFVQDLGNKNVIFETDCQTQVRCFEKSQPNLDEWQSRGILDDILGTLKSKPSFSNHFIPRQGNKATNLLAASSCKGMYPTGWVEIPLPPFQFWLKTQRAPGISRIILRLSLGLKILVD
ncbi:hypothetical protein QN277_009749 [Acacia crassicarpa]|uniref:RNase H type-1 domain-containing protein n=1 Tax=Acacia crassicarpa TaxID=499986 RepID=A0AAE1IRL1_9FABA|nr:hypothetical protein QN277_009749 [Acacia crassicarpa]